MNQSAKRDDLRLAMPNTVRWVEERRREYGAEYVNDCMRRAMAGEAGLFYAIESGHVLGTAFAADSSMADWQRWAIVAGMKFAAFMARPQGKDGTYAALSAGEGAHGTD